MDMPKRRQVLATLAAMPLVGLAVPAQASEPPVFSSRGVAIRGYDPVAYFTNGAPVRGKAEHGIEWQGTEWRFASAANRAAFESDPGAYAPQYGGYCAWAVSRGYTASTDPDAWKIVDGKLYLNFNRRVQRMWEGDIPGNIARGDANWPAVLSQ